MSLCDRCYAPGACCKAMFLTSDKEPDGLRVYADGRRSDLPRDAAFFEPTRKIEDGVDDKGRAFETWMYACPKLLADGRCGVYETRPQLCRDFEAGSGALCVHYQGAEAGADPL